MIYTSCFAKLQKLPENVVSVAICAKHPAGITICSTKKTCTEIRFLRSGRKNHDNDYYNRCFDEQVLAPLDAGQALTELQQMVGENKDIALICYEKLGNFCHRHRVAAWLSKCLGISVDEMML